MRNFGAIIWVIILASGCAAQRAGWVRAEFNGDAASASVVVCKQDDGVLECVPAEPVVEALKEEWQEAEDSTCVERRWKTDGSGEHEGSL